jgi:hypothetical protein
MLGPGSLHLNQSSEWEESQNGEEHGAEAGPARQKPGMHKAGSRGRGFDSTAGGGTKRRQQQVLKAQSQKRLQLRSEAEV